MTSECANEWKELANYASSFLYANEGPMKFYKEIGDPHRNRTYNLLIKSQLLCQLS